MCYMASILSLVTIHELTYQINWIKMHSSGSTEKMKFNECSVRNLLSGRKKRALLAFCLRYSLKLTMEVTYSFMHKTVVLPRVCMGKSVNLSPPFKGKNIH
jgi:hypothetical protein